MLIHAALSRYSAALALVLLLAGCVPPPSSAPAAPTPAIPPPLPAPGVGYAGPSASSATLLPAQKAAPPAPAAVVDGRLLVATTRPSSRPRSDLSGDYRLAWWSRGGMRAVPLPDDARGVLDAAIRPGGGVLLTIVGGARLLRTDENGQTPEDVIPAVSGAQPGNVQSYLSVTWLGPTRVLVRETPPAGLFILDPATQARTSVSLSGLDPATSPDGTHLALGYAADRPYLSIFVAAEPFDNATKLTADSVPEAAPAWSPDGEWVAYAAQASPPGGGQPGSEVRVVRANGTEEQTIVPVRAGITYTNLAWSPDGAHIGFTRYQEAAHTRQISIVDRDGSHELAISDEAANDRLLAWIN